MPCGKFAVTVFNDPEIYICSRESVDRTISCPSLLNRHMGIKLSPDSKNELFLKTDSGILKINTTEGSNEIQPIVTRAQLKVDSYDNNTMHVVKRPQTGEIVLLETAMREVKQGQYMVSQCFAITHTIKQEEKK